MMGKLNCTNHVGGCCGIQHLHGFHAYNSHECTKKAFVLAGLQTVIDRYRPPKSSPYTCPCNGCMGYHRMAAEKAGIPFDEYTANKLKEYEKTRQEWVAAVECVLAAGQYKEWKNTLEECGFKEVFTFKNSNSSNQCHIFYGTTQIEAKSVESAPSDTAVTA